MIKGAFVGTKLSEEKVDKIVALGFNTLFVDDNNLNKKIIKLLKNKKIKVYIEVGIFKGEDLLKRHLQAWPINQKGKPMKRINGYLGVCPNHPKGRKEKLQLIKSIIQNHNIDGVWLDFIRYPCHWEVTNPDLTEYCFCPNCLQKFQQEVGGKPKGDGWIRWKCNQITNFVAQARCLIDQSGKNIKLGIFSVPWREKDFNRAILKIIGQDFRALAKSIDIFSPMVYHKMCGQKPKWIYKITTYMDKITGKRVLPIIQTQNTPEKISPKEFKEAVIEATKKPSQGVIAFFLEDLLKDKEKAEIVKEIFKR